jgi:hypothetical protein
LFIVSSNAALPLFGRACWRALWGKRSRLSMVTVEKPCHRESLSAWIAAKDGASSAPAHTSLALRC